MNNPRAQELRTFLRAMRARVDPATAGLPVGGKRRAPGIRIEEAAALAGVSVTWYSALESGVGVGVSAKLLERVAAALTLDPDERAHLFALARPSEPPPAQPIDDSMLHAIVNGFTVGPAFVCDRYWTVYACNALADEVYGHARAAERNLLVRMMLDPSFKTLHRDWEAIAQQMVAVLHLAFGRLPNPAVQRDVIDRLCAQSDDFAHWWKSYRIKSYTPVVARLLHPTLGELELSFTTFVASGIAQREDHLMIALQPPANEATRERLRAALEVSA